MINVEALKDRIGERARDKIVIDLGLRQRGEFYSWLVFSLFFLRMQTI